MSIIELLKVLLLGIVEGITEWLPISSTGHMLLVDEFVALNATPAFKEMFFVVIQLGAIMAVVLLYWNRMFPFSWKRRKPQIEPRIFALWFRVLVACLPAGIIGVLFDDWMTAHLETPAVIAAMLILYGGLFIVVENWNKHRRPRIKALEDIGYGTALMIGFFQVLSLIPGTSRSGATIIGALLIGVSRTAAAEFTFFLAVPTMLGASAFKLFKFGFDFTGTQLLTLGLGMLVAFLVSVATIKFLMDYIRRHDFKAFGWYRIALGLVVLGYFWLVR